MSFKQVIESKKGLALMALSLGIGCLILLSATTASAQVVGGLSEANSAAGLPGLAGGDLSTAIGQIISGLMGLIGSIMFVYLLYGGFRWMIAGGDAKGVSEAQSIIKNAIIGIAIIIFAYTLASFVIDKLASVASAPPTTATPAAATQCESGYTCTEDTKYSMAVPGCLVGATCGTNPPSTCVKGCTQ